MYVNIYFVYTKARRLDGEKVPFDIINNKLCR